MRELTVEENDLLSWVLPDERPGYKAVHDFLKARDVVAEGRRGEGHLILATPETIIDHDSPLPQVLAFGQIEHAGGECIITVRELLGDQLDIEITGTPRGEERRRWTLSHWSPGETCPQCSGTVREIKGVTLSGAQIFFVVCAVNKRLWLHEEKTRVNFPIPVTLYYSELMRQTGMKDPSLALDASRLFTHLSSFSDEDMLAAFVSYNDIRSKISTQDRVVLPERPRGLVSRLLSFFRKGS
jgi:hypothetical protein